MIKKLEQRSDHMQGQTGNTPTRSDWVGMTTGFLLCLVISLAFGYKRIFWEDEMLGWMLLHDPSWAHMVSAWNQGADGGGFTFYVTCRGWFKLFGASEISFRMYSAACFGTAFCVTWIAARRYYITRFVAPALFSAWFLSPPLVTHLAEGRFYGLLVLMVALVVWFTVSKSRQTNITVLRLCGWAFVLNGLLVTSHLLGVVYSATILVGMVLADRHAASWRPALYTATIASWLLLIPELTAIRATTQVGKPWFWTTPPNLSRFFGAYCEFSAPVAALLLLLLVLILLSRRGAPGGSKLLWRKSTQRRSSILFPVFILFLLPVALTLQARFATSLFINRYLMPLTVAEALLLCQLFSMVDWSWILSFTPAALTGKLLPLLGAASILVLGAYVFGHLIHFTIGATDFTPKLTARLPRGIPVLTEDAWMFTQVIGRQHASGVNYIYLLDWPQTISKSAPKLEVTQYHLMDNWKKVGYFSGSIAQREPFLAQHPHFLVLHVPTISPPEGPMIGNPLLERFEQTRGNQVRPYDSPDSGIEIWEVCRDSCRH